MFPSLATRERLLEAVGWVDHVSRAMRDRGAEPRAGVSARQGGGRAEVQRDERTGPGLQHKTVSGLVNRQSQHVCVPL